MVERLSPFPQKPELVVIVPSRGRPDNIRRVIEAWDVTGAWADASLLLALDGDDSTRSGYTVLLDAHRTLDLAKAGQLLGLMFAQWQPMVPKLNATAAAVAVAGDYRAVAFMGDDHLPRTAGWARRYLDALAELGTGIVYGDDRIQGEKLPTQWAMTADIVRTLSRMVPAPVEHLYCDNAVLALGKAASCIRYLPDVVIEHMHPVARKAALDDGYRRVNAPEQYRRDGAAYRRWVDEGLTQDAAAVRALREEASVGG